MVPCVSDEGEAMTYDESVALVEFLNERFRRAGMKRPIASIMAPWYTRAVPITWEKLIQWARRLGYDRA